MIKKTLKKNENKIFNRLKNVTSNKKLYVNENTYTKILYQTKNYTLAEKLHKKDFFIIFLNN